MASALAAPRPLLLSSLRTYIHAYTWYHTDIVMAGLRHSSSPINVQLRYMPIDGGSCSPSS